MDREEPRLDPNDLRDVQFRRRTSPSRREAKESFDLWWQIALGAFLALLAHSIITGLYMRWEISQGVKILNAEMKRNIDELEQSRPRISNRAIQSRYVPRPVNNDERCIDGKRFRRIQNGWQELPYDPC